MGSFRFVYGITFVLICMVATSVTVCSYLASRRRINLSVASFFFFVMLESALVFMDEYSGDKGLADFVAKDFPMMHPYLKLMLSVGVIVSVWATALMFAQRFSKRRFVAPSAVFACLEAASLLISGNNEKQFAFYSLRSIAILASLGYIAAVWRRSGNAGLRHYLNGFKHFFVLVGVFTILTFCEDAWHLVFRGTFTEAVDWIYFLSERNMSENAMTICCTCYAVLAASRALSLCFKQPPTTESAQAKQLAEVRFARFCDAHGISVRERDVLSEMLDGSDNRAIAERLVISTGTVKAHVHSIYKKCDVASRDALLQLFWSE